MRPSLPLEKEQRMQLALADHSADLPKPEERDQCDREDDPDKQYVTRTATADRGEALANCLPFDHAYKHFFRKVKDQKQH